MQPTMKRMARASLRQNVSQPPVVRNILSQPSGPVEMTPEMGASVVYDMALLRMWGAGAGKQVALALGVSESLVSRWRKPEYRELPSIGQIAAHGPEFVFVYLKEQRKFYGFGKRTILELLAMVGDVAEEMSA